MVDFINRKTSYRLLLFASLGGITPVVFLAGNCFNIDALYDFPHWVIYVWPTALMLLGFSGTSCPDADFLFGWTISFVGNMVLWVSLGFVACWVLFDVPWKRLLRNESAT
jgi:hypothetical protein